MVWMLMGSELSPPMQQSCAQETMAEGSAWLLSAS
jgi:hypothetical protein